MNRTPLASAFLLVTSSILGSACVIDVPGSFLSDGSGIRVRESAEREDVRALELAPEDVLSLSTDYGRVEVVATSDGPSEVRVTLHASGRTVEEARSVLERYEVVLERTPEGLRVELAGEPLRVRSGASQIELSAHADFHATVPEGTRLVATSGSGDLVTRGPLGTIELETGYGAISIEEARGGVRAKSGSGDVQASRITEGEAVLTSGYGEVVVKEASAKRVVCSSGSGDIRIASATAERIELSTHYGRVHVERSSGSIEASSGSGDVELHGVSGAIEAKSDYGKVEVDGVLEALTASSGSGDVRVRAREGSRVQSRWELDSSYGEVVLEAPEDFACVLDARTSYGSVECDFALTLEAGKRKSDSALKGTIGAGGGTVTLSSSSGDVALKRR